MANLIHWVSLSNNKLKPESPDYIFQMNGVVSVQRGVIHSGSRETACIIATFWIEIEINWRETDVPTSQQ